MENDYQELQDYIDKKKSFESDMEDLFKTLKFLEKDYKELKVMEEKLKF